MDKRILYIIMGLILLLPVVKADVFDDVKYVYDFDKAIGLKLEEKIESSQFGTLVNDSEQDIKVISTGKYYNAYNFSGDGYISMPKGNATNNFIDGLWNFTLCVWINLTKASGNAEIFGFRNTTQCYGHFMADDIGSGVYRNYGRIVTSIGGDCKESGNLQNNTIPKNVWTHICYTYDNQTLRLYQNGITNGTINTNGTIDQDIAVIGATAQYLDEFNGVMDELYIWDRNLSASEISKLYNSGTGYFYPNFKWKEGLNVTLISPVNNINNNTLNVTFIFNSSSNTTIAYCRLYGNESGTFNILTSRNYNNCTSIIEDTFVYNFSSDGSYSWNIQCFSLEADGWGTFNRTILLDSTPPTIILNSPINQSVQADNMTINITFSDTNLHSYYVNITKADGFLVYDDSGTISGATVYNYTGYIWVTNYTETLYLTSRICDTSSDINCVKQKIEFTPLNYTSTYISPVLEGTINQFLVNITHSVNEFNANLTYNHTNYTVVRTDYDSHYIFAVNITAPQVTSNTTIPFNWIFLNDTETILNASYQNQSIVNFDVGSCSSYPEVLINLTLYGEEDITLLTDNVTLEIEVTIRSAGYTWTYANSTNLSSIAVCVPSGTALWMENSTYPYSFDVIASFENPTHAREFWYLDNGTINSSCAFNSYTSCNISLYDLLLTDSTTFLFEFYDALGLTVDDAIIHTFRKYVGEGIFREVERSKQDENGETHLHLVEEDVIYYFMVTQYGEIIYTSSTYNAKCLSTPCLIELTASSGISEFPTDWNVINGTYYGISETKSTRQATLTFISNTSDLINFSIYRYNNNEATLINTTSTTGMSGSLTLTVPRSYGNMTFFGAVYKDNRFVYSDWIDFDETAQDIFGVSGAIFSGIAMMLLILMAVSEGVLLIVITSFALILMTVLVIVDFTWMALISIICAGGIIIWRLIHKK